MNHLAEKELTEKEYRQTGIRRPAIIILELVVNGYEGDPKSAYDSNNWAKWKCGKPLHTQILAYNKLAFSIDYDHSAQKMCRMA